MIDETVWVSWLYIIASNWIAQGATAHSKFNYKRISRRNKLAYLLSGVEHCMENSYLMLNEIVAELEKLEGVILYSMFMLPSDRVRRLEFFRRVLESGAILHAAVEGIELFDQSNLARWENIFSVDRIVTQNQVYEDVVCRI